jgi:hypothetical protein
MKVKEEFKTYEGVVFSHCACFLVDSACAILVHSHLCKLSLSKC